MSAYSRHSIISLMSESLIALRKLSKRFNRNDNLSNAYPFIVRIKVMENLAQLAFTYSLKVSYLNEQKEYALLAEYLDDVQLQIRRANVQYTASRFGEQVVREYESMQDAIDRMDERLKTIRVVCFSKRNRSRGRRNRKVSNVEPEKTEKYVRVRTPALYTTLPQTPVFHTQDPETAKQIEKNKQFNTKFSESIQKLSELNADFPTETNKEESLILQFREVSTLFNTIIENIELIAKGDEYRKKIGCNGLTFFQICIGKCYEFPIQINNRYEKVRRENARSNPELRSLRNETLNIIEKAKELCLQYYNEYPVEEETVEEVVEFLRHYMKV